MDTNKRLEYIRLNKNNIINYYKKSTNLSELATVLHNLKNTDINIEEINEIINAVSTRMTELNPLTLRQVVDEAKKENVDLNGYKIIESPKEINDLDNFGFKSDMFYLEYDDGYSKKLFEVDKEYLKEIRVILNDKISLKQFTKEELLEKLLPYMKELDDIEMDYKENLDKEEIEKEIDKIYDNEVKKAFTNNINNVLKERRLINEYIHDKGLLREKISYSLNSKGERLYRVGEKLIKFVGNNREMVFISEENLEKLNNDNVHDGGNIEKNNTNNLMEERIKEDSEDKIVNDGSVPDNLEEFDNEYYINSLNYVFEKVYNKNYLTEHELLLLETFLTLCTKVNEDNIPLSLFDMYDKYYNYLKESKDYLNSKISLLFKDRVNNDLEENEILEEKEKKDEDTLDNYENVPKTLEEFDNDSYINSINYIFEKIYSNVNLNDQERILIETFLTLCVNSDDKFIPMSLFGMYDKYYNYLKESKDYLNTKVSSLFKDKINSEKVKEKNNSDDKRLILDNNQNNSGFVSILYITISIIVILAVISYFVLVK